MSFSRVEKLFLLFTMLTGMTIAGEYGITRPASNALFLTFFSAKAFPWVWLATVPLNLFVVYLYNRFLPKIGPLRMMWAFGSLVLLVNGLCGLFLSAVPALIFLQFAWKDIYILLMFKQLWSMIHTTIPSTRAKYLYGIIFGMGTLGSILGSFIPSFFAVQIGSEKLFLFTVPLYLFLLFSYTMAFQRSGVSQTSFQSELTAQPKASEGLALIRRSPFLAGVLLLVVSMQIFVGLMEYRFNSHLELNILDKDMRTEYCGRLIGLMNMLSIFLQFVGGFLMVHTMGLRKSHLLVPLLLGSSALLSAAIPGFAVLSFAYVFTKAIDFSLFGIIREMLYIPLRLDEKFRAKAIIDVFAYRTSKALVSLSILIMQLIAGAQILSWISTFSFGILAAWLFLVVVLFKRDQPGMVS